MVINRTVYNLEHSLGHFLFSNNPVQWKTRATQNGTFKVIDAIRINICVISIDKECHPAEGLAMSNGNSNEKRR